MPHSVVVLARLSSPMVAPLRPISDVATVTVCADLEQYRAALPTATAVLIWDSDLAHLVREAWALAPHPQWIHTSAAGVDTLLFPDLMRSDTIVTNGRGAYAIPLAEFVLAAMLYFSRGLRRLLVEQERRRWTPFAVDELSGKQVGIIGLGQVGMAVARRLRSLDCVVVGCRRQATDWDASILTRVYLPEQLGALLRGSHYVVICAPLTNTSRGMIGGSELRRMRRDAVLINVGRGPIVDEAALIDALRSQRIKGAALDVFHDEPLLPSSPFYALENVLLSPHSADRSAEAEQRLTTLALENVRRFIAGEALLNVVNKEAGY